MSTRGEHRGDSNGGRYGAIGTLSRHRGFLMRKLGLAVLAVSAALALPFTSTPFDDDDDNDADAIDRRPVAGHHSSHNPECAAASSGLRVLHLDCGRDWRGGQAQVLMLMQGLARRGVDNLLLAPPGPLFDRARDRGYACERWSPRGDWDLVSLARAGLHLEARRPDVVHCHDARSHAVGVPAARLARVRAVVVSRRVTFPVGSNPLSAAKYRMPVDRYLCVSRGVMDSRRVAC